MKKVVLVVLCIVLVFGMTVMVTGCQSADSAVTEDATDDAADANEAAEVEEDADAGESKDTAGEADTAEVATEIPEGLTIAYFVSDYSNGYHQGDASWAKKYAMEKYGAEVQVFDGKSDPNTMAQNVDQMVAMGFDMCSVFVWNGDTVKDAVQEAIDYGTAMNSFYQTIGVEDNLLPMPHVPISEKEAAFEMGKVAATKWKEFHPDVPIVYGVIGWMQNEVVEAERTQPFINGILSVDPTAKEGMLLDATDQQLAFKACQDMIQAMPEINIIYSEAANLTEGVLPALQEAGRGKAVDGVPQTEILVSTDAPESELINLYDSTCSLKVTMGLTPKDNAIARIDNLMDIYTGAVAQDEYIEIPTYDFQIDYWNTDVKDAQDWYNEQYMGNITLEKK